MRSILLETVTMIRLQNSMITIDINNLINRYSMDKDDLKTKMVKLNKVDDNDLSVDARETLKEEYYLLVEQSKRKAKNDTDRYRKSY